MKHGRYHMRDWRRVGVSAGPGKATRALFANLAYAGGMQVSAISPGPHYREIDMDKNDKAPEKAKPEGVAPAPKQNRWPGQGNTGGIKNAKSVHDRKTTGRGAARGR